MTQPVYQHWEFTKFYFQHSYGIHKQMGNSNILFFRKVVYTRYDAPRSYSRWTLPSIVIQSLYLLEARVANTNIEDCNNKG
jgi:hypothetical protein